MRRHGDWVWEILFFELDQRLARRFVPRIDGQRGFHGGDGLLDQAPAGQRRTEVVADVGVGGIHLRGDLERIDGFGEPAGGSVCMGSGLGGKLDAAGASQGLARWMGTSPIIARPQPPRNAIVPAGRSSSEGSAICR